MDEIVCLRAGGKRSLWRISGFDFTVWIVTYACTAFVSIAVGLAVGMAVSCLLVIVQSQRVRARRLTRAANTEIYYHCSRPPTSLATTTTYSADTVTMPVGAVVYRLGVSQRRVRNCYGMRAVYEWFTAETVLSFTVPFVHFRWLGDRKGIGPVKTKLEQSPYILF